MTKSFAEIAEEAMKAGNAYVHDEPAAVTAMTFVIQLAELTAAKFEALERDKLADCDRVIMRACPAAVTADELREALDKEHGKKGYQEEGLRKMGSPFGLATPVDTIKDGLDSIVKLQTAYVELREREAEAVALVRETYEIVRLRRKAMGLEELDNWLERAKKLVGETG